MGKTVLITGASSGFGADSAREVADAGHVVYAGMRDIDGHNASAAADARAHTAAADGGGIIPVEMDGTDQAAIDRAVQIVLDDCGSIDVVVHNAGHMVLGPSEAFTVEQLAELYDVNVLSTQRLNRTVLPHLRAARQGLVVWIS